MQTRFGTLLGQALVASARHGYPTLTGHLAGCGHAARFGIVSGEYDPFSEYSPFSGFVDICVSFDQVDEAVWDQSPSAETALRDIRTALEASLRITRFEHQQVVHDGRPYLRLVWHLNLPACDAYPWDPHPLPESAPRVPVLARYEPEPPSEQDPEWNRWDEPEMRWEGA